MLGYDSGRKIRQIFEAPSVNEPAGTKYESSTEELETSKSSELSDEPKLTVLEEKHVQKPENLNKSPSTYELRKSNKSKPKSNVATELLKPKNNPFSELDWDELFKPDLKRPASPDESMKFPGSQKRSKVEDMLDGFRMANNNGSKLDDIVPVDRTPIATLLNIGNTCYLNSVIYILRFTPNFLHNLHHVSEDLSQVHQKVNQTKAKSSSLGRNMVGLSGASSRSWSSKDLPALGLTSNDNTNVPLKTPTQIAAEKLHELYQALHGNERKEHAQSFNAEAFLEAVQEVNRTFKGNQQQDAHELLMCIFEFIRETCKFLSTYHKAQSELLNESSNIKEAYVEEQPPPSSNSSKSIFTRKSLMKRNSKTSKNPPPVRQASVTVIGEQLADKDLINEKVVPADDLAQNKKAADYYYDFMACHFQGVTVSQTKCMTCECMTESREPMFDIPVPICVDIDPIKSKSDIYKDACVTSEYLRDQNKYYCSKCYGYKEAKRSMSYETLPRLLILQIKRFDQTMKKISEYMPTLLDLDCFCNECRELSEESKLHYYRLYGVIMHLGATMESGHYIAYARDLELQTDYVECSNRIRKNNLNGSQINSTHEKTTNSATSNLKSFFNRSKSSNNAAASMSGSNSSINQINSCCSALNCCSSKFSRSNYLSGTSHANENHINDSSTGIKTGYGATNHSRNNQSDMTSFEHPSRVWYKCDDATIEQISMEDFLELVSNNSPDQTATPYLLFYAKYDKKFSQ